MELKKDKILRYKLILNGLPKLYGGTNLFANVLGWNNQDGLVHPLFERGFEIPQDSATTNSLQALSQTNNIPNNLSIPGLSNQQKAEIGHIDIPKPGSVTFAYNKNNVTTVPKEGLEYILKNGKLPITTNKDQNNNKTGLVAGAIGEVANQVAATKPGFDHNDLIAGADRYQGNIRGVSYDRLSLDKNAIQKELDAKESANMWGSIGRMASLGGKAGGDLIKVKDGKLPRFFLGGLIGGAAGAVLGAGLGAWTNGIMRDKAKKEIDLAERMIGRGNLFNQNQAGSTAIQNEYLQEYGDTRNQSLKGYKNGKRVQSAYGLINAKQNAWVDGGELIMNTITGATQMVPNSKYTDSFPANLRPEDMVIPARDVKKMKGYKCGKLPKHVDGRGWDNVITSGAQILGGLGNYMNAAGQSVKMPNSYFLNPYGQIAANTLAGLRVSDYPILPELYNQYAKGMYAISNSGGLSGGQRALARLSALNNLLANYAKLQQSNQIQNNQYRSNYADYIGRLGAQEAANKMQAYQYDLDYYSKAHAARQAGMQGGIRDMISGLQNYYKNKTKWDMFAMSHKLYSDELEAKKKGLIS